MTAPRRIALGLGLALLALPAPAAAYWTAGSTAGGAGAAVAGSVGAVTGLRAASGPVTADPDVALGWQPATRADGGGVAGYRVRRYADDVATDVCGSAAAPVTAVACTDPALPDGTYSYGVAARVGGAWSGPESGRATVTVDATAPTITARPPATAASAAATFVFDHPRYARFACRLDDGAFEACDGGTATSAGLAAGAHTFAVIALDDAGHATRAATVAWTVAAAAPTLAGPAPTSADQSPTLTFAASGYASFACSVDGSAFAPCASPLVLAGLAAGPHAVAVHALDATGAPTADAWREWTLRIAPPSIAARPSSPSANTAPSVGFGDPVYGAFRCSLDGGAAVACTSPVSLAALNGGAALANGSHAFAVQAVDPDGHATAAAAFGFTVDAAAPSLATTTAVTSAATSATFTLADTSYATFACRLSGGLFGCASPTVLSGLADGPYTFSAHAVDVDGVATADVTFSWTVQHAPPTLTAQPASPTGQTAATFGFAETPYTAFQCRLDAGAFTACNAGSASYAGLAGGAGTTHTFTVHALDAAGNATADKTSTWVVDTVAPAAPTSAALANGGGTGSAYVDLGNRASVSVTVTLPASSAAADVVTVSLGDGAHVTAPRSAAAPAGAGSVTVSGIDASALTDGAVTISATTTDAAGNVSAARTATVTKDTLAPAAPVAARLSYTDANNATRDRVTGGGGAVESGATVQITQTAPTAGGPYLAVADTNGAFASTDVNAVAGTSQNPLTAIFAVVVVDPAGNASAATTFSAVDRK